MLCVFECGGVYERDELKFTYGLVPLCPVHGVECGISHKIVVCKICGTKEKKSKVVGSNVVLCSHCQKEKSKAAAKARRKLNKATGGAREIKGINSFYLTEDLDLTGVTLEESPCRGCEREYTALCKNSCGKIKAYQFLSARDDERKENNLYVVY